MKTKTAREVAKEQYKRIKKHVIRRWAVEADTGTGQVADMGMNDCVQDKLVRLEDKHVH